MHNNHKPFFGPAGNAESFFLAGNKSSLEAPSWLNSLGLDCYEYQCGHGVRISDDAAEILGERAKENNILLSIHAPYYISLSSKEVEKRDRSVEYIMQTLRAAKKMGADRIVVHMGSCASMPRKMAMQLTEETLYRTLNCAEKEGLDDIFICPETMGKLNQLGNVDEIIQICKMSDRLIPTIDFGHVNARTLGGLKKKSDFAAILNALEKRLNPYKAQNFHAHYSRIEYTKAGEKKHHTFSETQYEPDFEPLAELLAERGLSPRIICESAGTQAEDSVELKKIFERKLEDL